MHLQKRQMKKNEKTASGKFKFAQHGFFVFGSFVGLTLRHAGCIWVGRRIAVSLKIIQS